MDSSTEKEKTNETKDNSATKASSPSTSTKGSLFSSLPDSLYVQQSEKEPDSSKRLQGKLKEPEPKKDHVNNAVHATDSVSSGLKIPTSINIKGGAPKKEKKVQKEEVNKDIISPEEDNYDSLDSSESLWIMKPLKKEKEKKKLMIGQAKDDTHHKIEKDIELDESYDPFANKNQKSIDSLTPNVPKEEVRKKIEEDEEDPELVLAAIPGGTNSEGIPYRLQSVVQRKKFLAIIAFFVTGLFAFSAIMLANRLNNNEVDPTDTFATIPTPTLGESNRVDPTRLPAATIRPTATLSPTLVKPTKDPSITLLPTNTTKPTEVPELTSTPEVTNTPLPTVTTAPATSPTPTLAPTKVVPKVAATCERFTINNFDEPGAEIVAEDRVAFSLALKKPSHNGEVKLIHKLSSVFTINPNQNLPKGCKIVAKTNPKQQYLDCKFSKKTLPSKLEYRARVSKGAVASELNTFVFIETANVGVSSCSQELIITSNQQPTAIPTLAPSSTPTSTPKPTKEPTSVPTPSTVPTSTLGVTPTISPSQTVVPSPTILQPSVAEPTVASTATKIPVISPTGVEGTLVPTLKPTATVPPLPVKDVGIEIEKSGIAQCINSNSYIQVRYSLNLSNSSKNTKVINIVDVLDEKVSQSELDYVTLGGKLLENEIVWREFKIGAKESVELEYQLIIPAGEGTFDNSVEVRNSKDLVIFAKDDLSISTECLPIVSISPDRTDVLIIASILVLSGIITFTMGWHVTIGNKINLHIGYMLPKSSSNKDQFEESMRDIFE